MENKPESGLKLFNREVFLPGNDDAYQNWRTSKLANMPAENEVHAIKLRNLSQPGETALQSIVSQCANSNMAVYELENPGAVDSENCQKQLRADLKVFCGLLGLHDAETNRSQGDDGVVAIRVDKQGIGAGYIPYSDKPLSWHTDGYYNDRSSRIRAMVLHCVRDASEGGENELLDPELAYVRLRDENPAFIHALMDESAMTIPENTDARSAYRPASVGPVFFLDDVSGALNMRYTARARNINWREDDDTKGARNLLDEILRDDPFIVRHKFNPGQGIISNNVLHNRTRFVDNGAQDNIGGRLLFRIRYKQRVALSAQTKHQGGYHGQTQ